MGIKITLDPKTFRLELLRTAATLGSSGDYRTVGDSIEAAKAFMEACGFVEQDEPKSTEQSGWPNVCTANAGSSEHGRTGFYCNNPLPCPIHNKPETCEPESTLSDIAKHYYGKHSFIKQDLPATCQHGKPRFENGQYIDLVVCGSPLPCPKHPSV